MRLPLRGTIHISRRLVETLRNQIDLTITVIEDCLLLELISNQFQTSILHLFNQLREGLVRCQIITIIAIITTICCSLITTMKILKEQEDQQLVQVT